MSNAPQASQLDALAQTLTQSLERERDTLAALGAGIDRQMDALRANDRSALDDATYDVNAASAELERHRRARERQAALFARLIGSDDASLGGLVAALGARPDAAAAGTAIDGVRLEIRTLAARTSERAAAMETALQFAVQLGRDMVQTMRTLDAPPRSSVYTAKGKSHAAAPPTRSFLNQVG